MINRLLLLDAGQLRRSAPFFLLYVCLFAALTLADGLSLTLFVARVGADRLPFYLAGSALCVTTAMLCYLKFAERFAASRLFIGVLAVGLLLFLGVWIGLQSQFLAARHMGLLFLAREVASALVLLHFGAYLQEYFTRAELNRVMPFIYAGGRVGGIASGFALEYVGRITDVAHLLLLLVALLAVGLALVTLLARHVATVHDDSLPASLAAGDDETIRTITVSGFLRFVWTSPLLFWITASTVVYFGCRACLNVQYSQCFESAFPSEAELAGFVGRYTQIALAGSLIIQLFLINRAIAWLGLRGTQLLYAGLMAAVALVGWREMTLGIALLARFVESELRFGLRNPVSQMVVNQFARPVRTRARAWSLGIVIPLSTFAFGALLAGLIAWGASGWIATVAVLAAIAYCVACWQMAFHIVEPVAPLWRFTQPRLWSGDRGEKRTLPVPGPLPADAAQAAVAAN